MKRTSVFISCLIILAYTSIAQSIFCGPNEVLDFVNDNLPEKTCRNRFTVFNKYKWDPRPYTYKCVCAPGYYRNSIGECITGAQCARCSKPNEFYSCGSACDNECAKINTQNRTKCPIINIKCSEMCYCDDGYARDSAGNCIPVDQCKPTTCGLNEVKKCVQDCPPEKTCRNRDIEYFCTLQYKPCTVRCVCAPGYYRNSIEECISETQCDKCNKPNEFFSCGSECDNECKTLGYQNRTNCPIINIQCNEKCYCDDGYARDDFGKCISVDQCRKPCCDPNEEYTCSKSCPPDLCISLVARFKCDGNEASQYRYRCKPGYLREKEGSPCIPITQCPQFRDSLDIPILF